LGRSCRLHAGELASRFIVDDSFKHHEVGRIDDAAFFHNLRTSLGIGISDEQFLEGWNAIFAGEMPGIAPLLAMPANACRSTPSPTPIPLTSRISHERISDVLGHFREMSPWTASQAAPARLDVWRRRRRRTGFATPARRSPLPMIIRLPASGFLSLVEDRNISRK